MVHDYFKVLGVTRSAEREDINKAYRKLALKHHPRKSQEADAQSQFAVLAEAFDVLSDDRKKAIYIQFGIKGLKEGVPAHENYEGFPGGYEFSTDPETIFESFFGSKNPFEDFYATEYEPKMANIGSKNVQESSKTNEKTIHFKATLEDIYNGGLKVVEYQDHGKEEKIKIQIKKGWKEGTKVVHSRKGGEKLVFILEQLPHALFKREGDDLVYDYHIPLLDALVGSNLEIKTLDDRILRIPVFEVVRPGYTKSVVGEGFPIIEDDGNSIHEKRGNLAIRFHIDFPNYFNDEQRSYLKMAFGKQ